MSKILEGSSLGGKKLTGGRTAAGTWPGAGQAAPSDCSAEPGCGLPAARDEIMTLLSSQPAFSNLQVDT